MRSNRWLFSILYFLGLALCLSLFLLFVPEESRTNTKWLNFCIIMFLYSGLCLKYLLLYPLRGKFGDNVPSMAMYWISYGWYAGISLAAMVVFWIFNVGFEKQALLQGCLLFAFIVAVCIGLGASNFMAGESARVQREVGGVRALQQKVAVMKIAFAALPPEYSFLRTTVDGIAEEITYICGCNNPQAEELEGRIAGLLDSLQAQCASGVRAEECLATAKSIEAAVAIRKNLNNI